MLGLVITLAAIGFIMWLVNTYIPMTSPYKNIINIVVLVCVVLWLLYVFGVLPMGDVPVPQVR
jgi:hypothetical protein